MSRALPVLCGAAALLWRAAAPAGAAAACPRNAVSVAPGQSIQAAADAAGPGARICLLAGVHRLQSVIPVAGQRFSGAPGAIMDGARVLSGFVAAGGRWQAAAEAPVTGAHGVCAAGSPGCNQVAALFLDGVALRRAAAAAAVRPGWFFFDAGARRVVLADDPGGRRVEWAWTRHAFAGMAAGVSVSGLVIQHYANPAQEGAVWPGGRGWALSRIEARDNAGVGLVGGSGGVIRDCDVHGNGQLGIGAGGASGLLIEGNRVWGNNTAGYDDTWEAGGIKLAASRHVVLRGNDVHGNNGPGLWCDEECADVLIEGNTVSANSSAGIFYEISRDATIRGNTLRDNGAASPAWFWGAEIQVAASSGVAVTGNTLRVRPGGKAVMLIDQNRRRAEGGYYTTSRNRVEGNRIEFGGDGVTGGVSDAGPGAANSGIIQNGGNRFDGNEYSVRAGSTPWFVWGGRPSDFAALRAAGQERSGRLSFGAP